MNPPRPCDLCGLDVGKQPFPLATPEKELLFCCEGCRGIYEMLHDIAPPPDQNSGQTPEKS